MRASGHRGSLNVRGEGWGEADRARRERKAGKGAGRGREGGRTDEGRGRGTKPGRRWGEPTFTWMGMREEY